MTNDNNTTMIAMTTTTATTTTTTAQTTMTQRRKRRRKQSTPNNDDSFRWGKSWGCLACRLCLTCERLIWDGRRPLGHSPALRWTTGERRMTMVVGLWCVQRCCQENGDYDEAKGYSIWRVNEYSPLTVAPTVLAFCCCDRFQPRTPKEVCNDEYGMTWKM